MRNFTPKNSNKSPLTAILNLIQKLVGTDKQNETVAKCCENSTSLGGGCHTVTGEDKSVRPSLEFLSSLPFANKFFSLQGEMESLTSPWALAEQTNDSESCETACRMAEGCHTLTGEGKSVRPSLEFLSSLPFANKFFSLQGEMSSLPPLGEDVRRTGEGKNNVIAKESKKKAAFTLAEVLITIGIIGVVAAMTIPNLMNTYKANRLRTQFFKNYSLIKQSTRIMEENDEAIDISNFSYKNLKKYFKVAVDCGSIDKGYLTELPCYSLDSELPNTYKELSGRENSYGPYFTHGQLVLNDGANMYFGYWWEHWIGLTIDINGFSNPPNRMGYDTFYFVFRDGEWSTDSTHLCHPTAHDSQNGASCTPKAINEPDYFKWVVKNIKY